MQADVRSKASKSKTSQPVLSSSSSTISNSSEGAFPGDSTNPSHGNEANRIDRAVKLRDAFERFWDHARRNVEFIEQYGHIGPVEGWEYRCDTEFENAFRAIEKFLAPVQGARSFRQPRGIPNDAPIIAKSAHEALARFLNPPERLFGVMHALISPEYEAIRDAAEDELEQVLNPLPSAAADQGTSTAIASWCPFVKFAFDRDGHLVLSCPSRPKRRTTRTVLKGQGRDVFLVLTSAKYGAQTAHWDEYLWGQIWGIDRRDGRSPEAYSRDKKSGGKDGGVNSRIKWNVSRINRQLTAEFGPPPGGNWFNRVERRRVQGRFDSAYVPSDRVRWVDQVSRVPADTGPESTGDMDRFADGPKPEIRRGRRNRGGSDD
jgi:hypothetical protein